MRLGQLEVDLNELANFLVKAKKGGYAGSEEKRREADGSKTFTFQEGNFHYTDNYAGSLQAPGNEIVRWQRADGQRIWHMAYSGGMLKWFYDKEELTQETFKFLKEALMNVTPDLPFRGPERYVTKGGNQKRNFTYNMSVRGNLERFSGNENIVEFQGSSGRFLFTQDFIGGLVIPKIK